MHGKGHCQEKLPLPHDVGRRAGIEGIHAHRLRHTAATGMLRAGGSWIEVGQVPRHRSAASTAKYTKVDYAALARKLAMTDTGNDRNDLARVVEKYLQMRRTMGYQLRQDGQLLMDFAQYFEGSGVTDLTSKIAVDWASLPKGDAPRWWHLRLSAVKAFAQYLQAFDTQTQGPRLPCFLTSHTVRDRTSTLT